MRSNLAAGRTLSTLQPMTKDDLKSAVTALLQPVVTAKFAVLAEQDGHLFAVVVRPSPRDMSRLIGQGGANFQAVKRLLEHAGERQGVRVRYFVKDPDPGTKPPPSASVDKVNTEQIRSAAKAILGLAGYPTEVLIVEREHRYIMTIAAELPYVFNDSFERWLNVCAKSQGGSLILDAERIPS